ncbi:fumarase alpha subunit [Syntrophobotulus glycolicus DSM 8271]|uniref:Fumarase alpha subunit n=1 Tax=Syntrophobotulus glycolicus (strain DSM 8271 / FlGlyR) TaxID=645991 RepID=F0SWL6_SYNGF|nr:fumarate hydratase [Syntrophobotulus glycolicus]ADY56856.1 fumarase alpha subunit [Syntrophobotulus glycolicus DSM 8271]
MKEIHIDRIIEAVEGLCIEANYKMNGDLKKALGDALSKEESDLGKEALGFILENARLAETEHIPICQDTGMTVVFVELGQDVHITGGPLTEAIDEGVRRGYVNGYLRKSIVRDPFDRINTGDNTPAVIHYELVPGEQIKITVAPKGFGSENMGALKMCKPYEGLEGVKSFVLETVDKAGANPCPPMIVGVGVGGTMEKAAILAKKALLRPQGQKNAQERLAIIEDELLTKINAMGIGPAGFGGRMTALAVNMEVFPTHIAGLPVAVNINCHVSRHLSVVLEGIENHA